MSYDVQIAEQAKTDMRAIYSHIAYQLLEPAIAKKQYARIKAGILSLEEMPERYSLCPDEPWHSRGLRRLVVDNYLAFYLVDTESKTVTVIRVMYGGQDINAQLGESVPDVEL